MKKAIVSGLLTQVSAIAIGMLARNNMEKIQATSI